MPKVSEDRPGVIYGLRYRSGDQYLYVGMSVDVKKRFNTHRSHARNGRHEPVYAWMRRLGIEAVVYDILEDCVGVSDLERAERHWISELRKHGHPLLNVTEGGFGGDTKTIYDENWREAFDQGMTARKTFRGGTIHKWRAAHPETREQADARTVKLVGIKRSPETRARMAAAQKLRREKEAQA